MSTPAPLTDSARNRVALGTIVRREVNRILRIWGQTLVPPAITMTLYFLIFGGLIGSKIGDMGGYSYMDFVRVGTPLNLITWAAAMVAIPIFFPF